ncbi:hypothetical protein [Leptolyngbya iicbica]
MQNWPQPWNLAPGKPQYAFLRQDDAPDVGLNPTVRMPDMGALSIKRSRQARGQNHTALDHHFAQRRTI